MAPNLPSQDKSPTVNLDINTTYLDLKNNNHEINLRIKSSASIDKETIFVIELQYAGLIKSIIKSEEDKKINHFWKLFFSPMREAFLVTLLWKVVLNH